MDKKTNVFEKIGTFIAGKGFYLVVLICVAAITLSGFYLVRSVRSDLNSGNDQPVGGTAPLPSSSPSLTPSVSPSLSVTPKPVPSAPVKPSHSPSAAPSPSVKPSPSPSVSPSVSPAPAQSPSPAALVFTWPVNGTILTDYSIDVLAYDVTMDDWRTHAGIDIGASNGTAVKAVAAGTVSAIYKDDLLGTTVVIDHNSQLISVYSNLAAVPTVKVGDKVSTGTVIGAVGKTAISESGLNPHLHLSMYRDNEPVNPLDYLPKQ